MKGIIVCCWKTKFGKQFRTIFIQLLRYRKRMWYLLQQRALEQLKIFVSVLAVIPRDWPRAKASETPSMLTAIAKLLQIFAAWITKAFRRPITVNINYCIQQLATWYKDTKSLETLQCRSQLTDTQIQAHVHHICQHHTCERSKPSIRWLHYFWPKTQATGHGPGRTDGENSVSTWDWAMSCPGFT